jgi:hypothetical protein
MKQNVLDLWLMLMSKVCQFMRLFEYAYQIEMQDIYIVYVVYPVRAPARSANSEQYDPQLFTLHRNDIQDNFSMHIAANPSSPLPTTQHITL